MENIKVGDKVWVYLNDIPKEIEITYHCQDTDRYLNIDLAKFRFHSDNLFASEEDGIQHQIDVCGQLLTQLVQQTHSCRDKLDYLKTY